MRKNYDFSKSKKNPYIRASKQQVTIRLEPTVITYFKKLSSETGMPYQHLINLFLRECAESGRRPSLKWG